MQCSEGDRMQGAQDDSCIHTISSRGNNFSRSKEEEIDMKTFLGEMKRNAKSKSRTPVQLREHFELSGGDMCPLSADKVFDGREYVLFLYERPVGRYSKQKLWIVNDISRAAEQIQALFRRHHHKKIHRFMEKAFENNQIGLELF
jgi:hypothetical protein